MVLMNCFAVLRRK